MRKSEWHALDDDGGEVEVANSGSTARDHLANERTFLAWLRTAISLIAFGMAIGKISPGRTGLAVGIAFIALGAVFLYYAGRRYFSVADALEHGKFRVNKHGIKFLLFLVSLVGMGCAVVIWVEAADLPTKLREAGHAAIAAIEHES